MTVLSPEWRFPASPPARFCAGAPFWGDSGRLDGFPAALVWRSRRRIAAIAGLQCKCTLELRTVQKIRAIARAWPIRQFIAAAQDERACQADVFFHQLLVVETPPSRQCTLCLRHASMNFARFLNFADRRTGRGCPFPRKNTVGADQDRVESGHGGNGVDYRDRIGRSQHHADERFAVRDGRRFADRQAAVCKMVECP